MPRGRVYQGPLLPGQRTAAVPKKRATTKSTKKKGDLTKKQQKQTKEIVQNEIKKEADNKYFNVRDMNEMTNGGVGLKLVPARSSYARMYVLGFATGTGAQTGGQDTLKYGYDAVDGETKSIQALQHGKIFPAGDTNGYDVQGSYVTPSLNITTFNLQRLYEAMSDQFDDALRTVPYLVRVLRLIPRPLKGSFQTMDPERDAFVDQFNQEIGIRNGNFKQYELHMLKPNTKKYSVKLDNKFVINPSTIYNKLDIATGDYQVSNTYNTCFTQMTFKHDIGKKLFYESPKEASNPTDGFKNEYILFHIVPLGAADQPGINPDNCRIGVKSVGTFKDF